MTVTAVEPAAAVVDVDELMETLEQLLGQLLGEDYAEQIRDVLDDGTTPVHLLQYVKALLEANEVDPNTVLAAVDAVRDQLLAADPGLDDACQTFLAPTTQALLAIYESIMVPESIVSTDLSEVLGAVATPGDATFFMLDLDLGIVCEE